MIYSKLQIGDNIIIWADVTYLSELMQSNKFYVRQACKDLWEFLDSNSEDIRSVEGSPGVGKSIAVFMYAVQQAVDHRLVYIQGDSHSNRIVYDQNGEYKSSL